MIALIDERLSAPWTVEEGASPVVAVALHNGHEVQPGIEALMSATATDRLREEDPYTDMLTHVVPTRVVVNRSRFEVDLNRPLEEAVEGREPASWGLRVWTGRPPRWIVDNARALHAAFYAEMKGLLERTASRHGRFAVLDLHSYNYRRGGPEADPEDAYDNPDVNVGTGSLDRDRWGHAVDRFIEDLSSHPLGLDVRENVKFRGRYLASWIHAGFQEEGCCLAIEFKKTYMDEWTGKLDRSRMSRLVEALAHTVPGLQQELEKP